MTRQITMNPRPHSASALASLVLLLVFVNNCLPLSAYLSNNQIISCATTSVFSKHSYLQFSSTHTIVALATLSQYQGAMTSTHLSASSLETRPSSTGTRRKGGSGGSSPVPSSPSPSYSSYSSPPISSSSPSASSNYGMSYLKIKQSKMTYAQQAPSRPYQASSDYLTAPMLPKDVLLRQLTPENRRHMELGSTLWARYAKLRLLTDEEERTAGKFSHVGSRLMAGKKSLTKQLNRAPTTEEWAAACNVSVSHLQLYMDVAGKARQRLVQHNMRMLDHWVRRFLEHTSAAKQVSYYELLVEGLKGLTKAAEMYDGSSPFYNFAKLYIRADLYRGLTSLRPGSFVSHKTVMSSYKVNRMKWRLADTLQRLPTDKEVAKELRMDERTLRSVREIAAMETVSADAPASLKGGFRSSSRIGSGGSSESSGGDRDVDDVGGGSVGEGGDGDTASGEGSLMGQGGGMSFGSSAGEGAVRGRGSGNVVHQRSGFGDAGIAATASFAKAASSDALGAEGMEGPQSSYLDMFLSTDQISESTERLLWKADLNSALGCLTPQEHRVLNLRYGLDGSTSLTVTRTAQLMALSTEMIRRISIKAFEKLRNNAQTTEMWQQGPPLPQLSPHAQTFKY